MKHVNSDYICKCQANKSYVTNVMLPVMAGNQEFFNLNEISRKFLNQSKQDLILKNRLFPTIGDPQGKYSILGRLRFLSYTGKERGRALNDICRNAIELLICGVKHYNSTIYHIRTN
ncbi:MAG: hypothetical protein WA816_11440 [Bacteroidales bacterium]